MNRQARKTRQAIYDSLSQLLMKKQFSKITMQEIADLADVGRSTVYSHFDTKEEVLSSMCNDIFSEMFTGEHIHSDSHEELLLHLLEHIKENQKIIVGLFQSEETEILTDYFRQYFGGILNQSLLVSYDEKKTGIPKDFLIHHLIGSFMEMIRWWAKNNMKQEPQVMVEYYLRMVMPVILSL